MAKNKRETGSFYEKQVGLYLERKGYEILEYNYRCKNGEIDIIARKDSCIVFCEVKYRKGNDVNIPLEAISIQKQRKISKVALYYLTRHHLLDTECRFDAIGIAGEKIVHIENAFEYIGV